MIFSLQIQRLVKKPEYGFEVQIISKWKYVFRC